MTMRTNVFTSVYASTYLTRRTQREAGFSFIDVLLSLVVLTFGVLALADLQVIAVSGNNSSRHLSSAVSVAEQKMEQDRKSTRLNSSHLVISYAVFCLKKQIQPSIALLHVRLLATRVDPNSTLAQNAHLFLDVNVEQGACPLNLAPTSRTTVMLAVGDA